MSIIDTQIPAAAAPRKLLQGCGPAGRRLEESSDGVFEEDGEGEGVQTTEEATRKFSVDGAVKSRKRVDHGLFRGLQGCAWRR